MDFEASRAHPDLPYGRLRAVILELAEIHPRYSEGSIGEEAEFRMSRIANCLLRYVGGGLTPAQRDFLERLQTAQSVGGDGQSAIAVAACGQSITVGTARNRISSISSLMGTTTLQQTLDTWSRIRNAEQATT